MTLSVTLTMEHPDGVIDTMTLHDPFRDVFNEGVPHAKVAITVGSSNGYGESRVSVTLSLECDQDEETIDLAIKTAFDKASDAASTLFTEWANRTTKP